MDDTFNIGLLASPHRFHI